MRFPTTFAFPCALVTLAACGGGSSSPDLGAPLDLGDDSAVTDAGHDAGRDAGTPRDAGMPDVAAWEAAQHADNMQVCACFATGLGYPTAADCTMGQDGPTEVTTCETMAATSTIGGSGASILCRTNALTAHAACLMTAACNMTMVTACNSTLTSALMGCDLPMTYFDALDTCATTSVVGTGADTCSDTAAASMAVGMDVFDGTTLGAGDQRMGSCPMGGGGAADVAMRWTAPAAGTYTIDTIGSLFDTVLFVVDGCGTTATELACSDDISTMGGNYRSSLDITLTAGQTVQIIVDGYDSVAAGPYVVNITAPGATDGGVADGGGTDAGDVDAGDVDAGDVDAGTVSDGGSPG